MQPVFITAKSILTMSPLSESLGNVENGTDHQKSVDCIKDDVRTTLREVVTQTKAHGNTMKLFWTACAVMSVFQAPKQVQVLCRILASFSAMCSWHGNMLSVGKTVSQLAIAGFENYKNKQPNNTIAPLESTFAL